MCDKFVSCIYLNSGVVGNVIDVERSYCCSDPLSEIPAVLRPFVLYSVFNFFSWVYAVVKQAPVLVLHTLQSRH